MDKGYAGEARANDNGVIVYVLIVLHGAAPCLYLWLSRFHVKTLNGDSNRLCLFDISAKVILSKLAGRK